MIDHIQYVNAQIADRSKRIADIERDLLELRAELRVYEDMRTRLAGDAQPVRRQARAVAVEKPTAVVPRRKLGELSRILVTAAVRAYPTAISTDDGIRVAAERTGKDVSRNNVRSSLWTNNSVGLLERVSDGMFRATAKGAEMIGETLGAAPNQATGVNAGLNAEGEADEGVGEGPPRVEPDLLTGAPANPLTDERADP